MGNGKCGQRGIMVNTADRDGAPRGMGNIANGVHGHNLGHMGNGKHGQRGIMINTADRDGTHWGMGHMGDGTHGQWGTWAMGHMSII